MNNIGLAAVLSVVVTTPSSHGTCLSSECMPSQALNSTAVFGIYTAAVCEDLKTYVHCLSTELHGCVGESEERTTLQELADKNYVTILYRCDYFGANGICDEADCTFVADLSKGYTTKSCNEMAMYIKCLNMELWECGPNTLYGTVVESKVDSLMLDSELHCGSTKPGVIRVMMLILLTSAVSVTKG